MIEEARQRKSSQDWFMMTHLPSLNVLHDLLFPCERSLLSSISVAITLGQEERNEMNSGPSFLALEFSSGNNGPENFGHRWHRQ